MRNIKLTLAYDGTDFHGWQIQPGQPTIQGHLNEVLSKITQESIFVHGAGRTDAGVHALGQVAHFHTESRLTLDEIQHALNALMPPTIRTLGAQDGPHDFHARHHATGKTYRYCIHRGGVLPPFLHRYALHYPGPLDEEAMARAAKLFEGEHNFTYFSASAGIEPADGQGLAEPNPMRTIWESQILRLPASASSGSEPSSEVPVHSGDELIYVVRGRSFLRYMVRKIAGTLLDVGRGHLEAAAIPALFDIRERTKSAPTLPPQGLFLVSVEYPG